MKQVLRKGLSEIAIEEVPDPVLLPHHALIRPRCSLISSGTESAAIHREGLLKEAADHPADIRKTLDAMMTMGPSRALAEVQAKLRDFTVLGYSGAGIVVDRHATVTDLEIGDRVAYGGEGTGHCETVSAARNLIVNIPESVSFQDACFTTLGSIAINAVRTAQIGLGDIVAVVGLGLVGQLIAQIVKLQGGVVVGVDLKPERIELARRLGADYAFAPDASMPSAIKALSAGRGVDCAIVAAASRSAGPAQQALSICRDRGRLVIVGAVSLEFPREEMYLKEIQLFMARAYGPGSYDPAYEKHARDYPVAYVRWTENRNMQEFVRLLDSGQMRTEPLVTHEFGLADAGKAYDTILEPRSKSLAVVLKYPDADSGNAHQPFKPIHKLALQLRRPSQEELGVALLGAGHIARWIHLPNLKRIPKIALRAVHSSSGPRGKSYALRFGAEYCCTDYDEILNDPRVDIVLITTRHEHHAAQALAALRAGKHVFIEKPMAVTAQECALLCRAVAETGRQLTVGFNRRFAPFYIEQKRILAPRTGPAVVNCRINSPALSGAHWVNDPGSGGAIIGEACHFVDLLRWMLDSEPLSVSAYSLPIGKSEPFGENNIAATFRFAEGSVANLTYCTVGSKSSGGERVEVFAQGAGAFTEDFKRIDVRTSRQKTTSRFWVDKGYAAQLSEFVASIRKGTAAEVTVQDGARATIACLALLQSARTLAPCDIDYGALDCR
jgi:predicted dehydrogenase